MPGLVPGIYVVARPQQGKAWMAGTSPAMTNATPEREVRYDPFDIVVVPFAVPPERRQAVHLLGPPGTGKTH